MAMLVHTLFLATLIISVSCASNSAAVPTAKDETAVGNDAAGQADCISKGLANHWTRAQADACTDAVRAKRPTEVFPDGGSQ